MNVLVTGATGLVGGAAVRALVQHGHRVLALVRNAKRGASRGDANRVIIEGIVCFLNLS